MAATTRVQDTIEFVKAYLNWANLAIGTDGEPAITAANMTLQTIVGPPFIWPWNRSTVTFLTTEGQQDYNTSISNFGWLESVSIQPAAVITHVTVTSNVAVFTAANKFSALLQNGSVSATISGCTTSALNGVQTIIDATDTTFTCNITTANVSENESGAKALAGLKNQVEIVWKSQGEASEEDRPTFISTQTSDESGTTFMFRFLPVPDQTYNVILTYQESPVAIRVISDTWGIPNQLQYIYTYFFMFFMMDYFEMPAEAAKYRQLAIASLLARQSGLKLSDRNLFLGNFLPLMQEEGTSGMDTQQGSQARGL